LRNKIFIVNYIIKNFNFIKIVKNESIKSAELILVTAIFLAKNACLTICYASVTVVLIDISKCSAFSLIKTTIYSNAIIIKKNLA